VIFSKKVQYGMLLTLYLSRAGRSKADAIAGTLGLSRSFLDQVARKLRQAGVIKSAKGPGGGYELVGEPTVKDVFRALGGIPVMKSKDHDVLKTGVDTEKRSLSRYVYALKTSLSLLMDTPVRAIVTDSVKDELSQLNTVDVLRAS